MVYILFHSFFFLCSFLLKYFAACFLRGIITPLLIICFFYSNASSAGTFQVLQASKEVQLLMDGEVIKEVQTLEGDLKFKFQNESVDVFKNTILQFSGEAINLKQGSFRLRSERLENLKLQTPIGTLTATSVGDYIFHYNPTKATATIDVLEGSALIQGLYHEEILNIQKGERGHFVGVPEAEGPAFDILLKGRKSVRGKTVGPEKLSEDQLKELRAQFVIALKPKVVKKPKPKPKPGQICTEPFAKYNECVWRCLGPSKKQGECAIQNPKVQCVREKCLANGEWGDREILKGAAKSACTTSGLRVDSCQY